MLWFGNLSNRRGKGVGRSQGLLTAPPADEEEDVDHEDYVTYGGRQSRYRDNPNVDEGDADDVIPTHHRAGNGNDNSSPGRRTGPLLEVSGLAPGGNEWTT
ncbi:MAG: hypothetical protein M1813_000186 [Trichoglossum hirsutum]|nr:MAG: hypothetical protein M1813_000186 [Trichoglossum hirsutum]